MREFSRQGTSQAEMGRQGRGQGSFDPSGLATMLLNFRNQGSPTAQAPRFIAPEPLREGQMMFRPQARQLGGSIPTAPKDFSPQVGNQDMQFRPQGNRMGR